jgi:hypothetical protein
VTHPQVRPDPAFGLLELYDEALPHVYGYLLAHCGDDLSYKHMYLLVRRYGETSWTAALLPVSVESEYHHAA